MIEYFANLSWQQKRELVVFYGLDFEMFGYSPVPYV